MNILPSFRVQTVTMAETKKIAGCQPLKPQAETIPVALKSLDKDIFESSEKKEDKLQQSSEKSRVSFGEKAIQKIKGFLKLPVKTDKKA